MTDPYVDFFLNSSSDVIQLELFEVTHPDFSQPYRYVRNQRGGVTVTLPVDGSTFFDYRPVRIRRSREGGDLLQAITIDLGDPGEVFGAEIDRLVAAGTMTTKPKLRYWVYRSDDLAVPLLGPLNYEVVNVSAKGGYVTAEAQAPEKNASRTGELYTFSRFPMLRGLI